MICYKKISVFGIMLLICSTNLFAQGPGPLWEKTYGGTGTDWGYSVRQTFDGGYVIAGRTYSFGAGNWDFYLIKTDVNGDTLWTKTYGGTNIDIAYSVKQTSDSGYIIVGYTTSFGQGGKDVYLVRANKSGDTLWTKTYGGGYADRGSSVQQTIDGGYIITGYTSSSRMQSSFDVYLIKTATNGDTVWTKTFGGTEHDEAYSVQQTLDGGYIITGYTRSFGAGHSDVYLIKTDALGDTLWTRTYGGTDLDVGNSVQQTLDGGYIITGYTSSFGAGDHGICLIKTDTFGDTLWTSTYGGTFEDVGREVRQTSDSAYIITGNVFRDVFLIKTSRFILNFPNGDEILVWYAYHNIIWFCDKFQSTKHHFQLLFSSDGGISYPDTIAKDISQDSTTWIWSIPRIYSTTCRVKIQVLDSLNNLLAEDESNSNFTVTPIHLISPNGGERLSWYSVHDIIWECEYGSLTPKTSHYQLLLSSDGGVNYPDTIAKNISSDHSSWEWETPPIESSECRVKIQFYNSGILFAEDESDSNFTITGIAVEEKEDEQPPKWLRELVVYPNPFTKVLNIRRLGNTEKQTVNLKIYDLSGRLVKDFSLPTTKSSHTTTIFWDGKNKHGKDLSSGVYFLRFEAGKYKVTKQILLVR